MSKLKLPMTGKGRGDFQTPPEALIPLLPYLRREWTIWECAMGEGNLVRAFFGMGWSIMGSDKSTIGEYNEHNKKNNHTYKGH